MIKKPFFLQLCLLIMAGITTAQQQQFMIDGKITGKTGAYIFLSHNGNKYLDSTQILNGKFSFSGTIDGPSQVTVMMDRNNRSFDKYVQLYIVPGAMQLSLNYSHFNDGAVLKGSSIQDEADKLNSLKAVVMSQVKPLYEAYDKANSVYIAAIKEKKDEAILEDLKMKANEAKDAIEPYGKELGEIEEKFMNEHPASYVTASILRYRISNMTLKEGEERYNRLTETVKNSSLGKEIKKELDGLRMGSPGATASLFSSTELRGEPLSLSDYKGKYVLLDFWASWCVPCRAGNPHLLTLYSKYKDVGKGMEIIGVSDDDSKPEAWKKAVEKDSIGVWKHVLRGLKRVDGPAMFDRTNDISGGYGIHSLPTKILIDPSGVIIGRYGGGGEDDEALDKKLSEVFGR